MLTIKRELNRIAKNYPAIPRVNENSGVYDLETEEAVKEFQRIFNLEPDGVVGKATWYKIKQIFAGVKRLSEITSEGLELSEVEKRYTRELQIGDSGVDVEALQYYLAFLGYFFPELPPIPITGFFGTFTRDAVFTFQNNYGLPVTGVVDANVFNEIERAYRSAVSDLPPSYQTAIGEPYPGRFIIEGDRGESVRIIQRYLNVVAQGNPSIPTVAVDGIFGPRTRAAVTAFQRSLGFEQNGAVGPAEWAELVIRGNNL